MVSSVQHGSGTFVGTGAEIEIKGDKVGFLPRTVVLHNLTTGVEAKFVEGMDAGTAFVRDADGSAETVAAPNGITPLASGFKVGAAFAANNDVVAYECVG